MKRLTDRRTAEQVRENIEKLRAAGVEPSVSDVRYVKLAEYEDKEERGAWISYNWHEGIFDGWGMQCNQCLERYKYGLRKKNYCPNCGARMDGEK